MMKYIIKHIIKRVAKHMIKLLPVMAAGAYLVIVRYLRYGLILTRRGTVTETGQCLYSYRMEVSFEAIFLLGLMSIFAAIAVVALLKYMSLTDGVIWYLTFAALGAALSLPSDIRRSRNLELRLTDNTDLLTAMRLLQWFAVVLLVVSASVFITQVFTEKYRVRNMLDEILSGILALYLLRQQTGVYSQWYMLAAVSMIALGGVIVLVVAYIRKLKTKLEATEKCGYNMKEHEQHEGREEALW